MPEPLHPVMVHLPLALALLMPLVSIAATVAVFRGVPRPWAWGAVIALQATLCVSALVAIETGEQEEEVVEQVVPKDALELHEKRANLFYNIGWVALAVAGGGFFPGRAGKVFMILTVAATLSVTVLALRTGQSGGALVYEHGAAEAYRK